MPLPVEAIQVDGGSEFKAEFEQACQANEQLLVLVELVTPRSIDPRTVPSISAITTGPTASSPDKPRPVTTKRAQQSMPRHLRCADPADPRPRFVVFPRKAYDPARKVASW
jgi:hypothetical protein